MYVHSKTRIHETYICWCLNKPNFTPYIQRRAQRYIEQQPLSSECHDEQNQLSVDSGTTKFWAHGVRAIGNILAYKIVQEIFEGEKYIAMAYIP